MQQIQHQMFVTGRLHCNFEGFLVKESVTIRIMKEFNYENDVVPKLVSELLTKKYQDWKKLWRVTRRYCNTYGKVRNHKNATEWPEIRSVKKGAGKNSQLACSTHLQEGKNFQNNISFSEEH